MGDVYEDFTVDVEYPDTIVFRYYYRDEMDVEATATAIEGQAGQLEEQVRDQLFPAMASQGVEPTQGAVYEYYNNNGELIWSRSYSSQD